MKRREFLKTSLISTPIIIAGCTSLIKPDNGEIEPELLSILVNTAGVAVGFAVAGMAPEVDTTLRSLYNVAKEGKFDLTPLNELINEMLKNEDLVTRLVANRLLKIAELFGGMIIDENIADLGELDPELMQALADGYVEGFEMLNLEMARRATV